MYTLYYSPGACSQAVHVVLNELNAPFEAKAVNLRDPASRAELKKVNPREQVPTLVEDGYVITEGAAMMLYLLEKYPNELLPPIGTKERATALQWLMYLNASLHPTYVPTFHPERYVDGEQAQASVKQKTSQRVQEAWDKIEQQLEGKQYLCGDKLTVADILLTVLAGWKDWLTQPTQYGPNVQRVTESVRKRPAFAKAAAAEASQKKAA